MDIISLDLNREHKPGEGVAAALTFNEQLQTLIRGIAHHSIEGLPEDFIQLQRTMAEIAGKLHSESSPDDLMVAISATLRTLEEYNTKAAGLFKTQVEELRGMMAAMTETLQFVVSSARPA